MQAQNPKPAKPKRIPIPQSSDVVKKYRKAVNFANRLKGLMNDEKN